MRTSRLPNYLRMYRKRTGLCQLEIGRLLGLLRETDVSRHERFTRLPMLHTAFAYGAIFKVSVETLFPGTREEVGLLVRERALRRIGELERCEPTDQTRRQLRALRRVTADPS